jgi:hypothetical protein
MAREPVIGNYVAIAVAEPSRQEDRVGHSRLRKDRLTGHLDLRIRLLAPTFVASGAYTLHAGKPVKIPMISGGQPVIPGSSIKGACRQIFEVLTQGDGPFDPKDRDRSPPKHPPWSTDRALFGRLSYQGRISFGDAVAEKKLEELDLVGLALPYTPQKKLGRRFYGPLRMVRSEADRVPVAAIPAGTELGCRLHFRNASERELGLVLLSLGVGGRFQPRLGGGKYDRCGWCSFECSGLSLLPGSPAVGSAGAAAERWAAAAEAGLAPAAAKALAVLRSTLRAPAAGPIDSVRLEFLSSGLLEAPLSLDRKIELLAKVPKLLGLLLEAPVPRATGEGSDGRISSSSFGRLVAFHREHRSLPLLGDFLGELEVLDLYEQPNRDNPLATFRVLKGLIGSWLREEADLDAQEVLFVWSWAQRQLPSSSKGPDGRPRGSVATPPGSTNRPPRNQPPPRPPVKTQPFTGNTLADKLRKAGLVADDPKKREL